MSDEWCPDHDGSHCHALRDLAERVSRLESGAVVSNERAILTDLIAELRNRAAGYPGATGRWLTEEADRAEARLMSLNKGHKDMEVTGDE